MHHVNTQPCKIGNKYIGIKYTYHVSDPLLSKAVKSLNVRYKVLYEQGSTRLMLGAFQLLRVLKCKSLVIAFIVTLQSRRQPRNQEVKAWRNNMKCSFLNSKWVDEKECRGAQTQPVWRCSTSSYHSIEKSAKRCALIICRHYELTLSINPIYAISCLLLFCTFNI